MNSLIPRCASASAGDVIASRPMFASTKLQAIFSVSPFQARLVASISRPSGRARALARRRVAVRTLLAGAHLFAPFAVPAVGTRLFAEGSVPTGDARTRSGHVIAVTSVFTLALVQAARTVRSVAFLITFDARESG